MTLPQAQQPDKTAAGDRLNRWELVAFIAALLILLSPFVYLARDKRGKDLPEKEVLTFTGSEKCAACHQTAYQEWRGSHHDLAMDRATDKTVLGDFENVRFTDSHNGVTSRFFRRDGKFMVETEGPDGKPGIFEITYVFGVHPLQQYLVPFAGGRLQCLNIAWDAVKKQWYRLPPYEVKGAGDWLHWTRGGQTWNGMCAECHSTLVRKAYDSNQDGYATTWFEINVGCEACHGPGSIHVKWAEQPPLARAKVDNAGLAVRTDTADNNSKQVTICAPCHSRRFQLGDNDHRQGDLLDTMVPSLLVENLYYPDGQIQDEVYEYGSFTQSRMYRFGVRCSDCHNMHSLKLRKKDNELCLQCHRADEYDTPRHHFHKKEHEGKASEGALCIRCHMPGKHYMGIDFRLDHSLRIPRPDLSRTLATPNACSTSGCHDNKSLDWVVEQYTKWYGTVRKPHYGEIIDAARKRQPDTAPALIRLAEDARSSVIVRATALSLLRFYPGEPALATLKNALQDNESLIRYTALRTLERPDRDTTLSLIAPKLYDPVKAVRIEAAFRLAGVARELVRTDDLEAFDRGVAEYRQAMLYNSDFAAQRYNLGNLAVMEGNFDQASRSFEQALAIDNLFFPAKVNLAMIFNRQGANNKAETLLRQVVDQQPQLYETVYSLGLLLAEMGRLQEAADYLGRAADGMPSYARARYNQALALLQLKHEEEAMVTMAKAVMIEPANQDYFTTLAGLYLRSGQQSKALQLADTVLKQVPDHAAAKELRAHPDGR